jgi:signal transduction histidine kinase
MEAPKLTKLFRNISAKYFDPNLPLSVQSFNLLAFAGISAGLIVAVFSMLTGAGAANIGINLFASALGYALLWIATKTKRYRLCCRIVVIAVFLAAFPILFFTAGGYRSGMPCFFVFAIIFTALMLEKKECIAALLVQVSVYMGCILAAYFNPSLISDFAAEFYYMMDLVIGMAVSSIILLLVIRLHVRIYKNRQDKMDELNRELSARNEALTRYDRMKSDFLATVAHEIKTPLTIIAASAADTLDLLEESPLSTTEITDNQKRVEKTVKRIDAIVLDLMDTVAIENGRLSLDRQPISLAELIQNLCAEQFGKLNTNNNKLICEIQPNLPNVWADAQKIEQVLANLLSNAMRHTKNGLIKATLSGGGRKQTVSVADNGEGMDAEMVSAAMRQYVSTSPDNWRRGIGLYICRQIITAHGGEIWIDSQKGQGTAASFSLREGE